MRIGEGQRAVETDLGIETVVDVLFQLPQRAFRERIDVDFDLFVVVDLFLFLDDINHLTQLVVLQLVDIERECSLFLECHRPANR